MTQSTSYMTSLMQLIQIYTYTAKFVFLGVRNNKDQQMRRLKINIICT